MSLISQVESGNCEGTKDENEDIEMGQWQKGTREKHEWEESAASEKVKKKKKKEKETRLSTTTSLIHYPEH